jgi:hypothetical protein
MGGAGMTRWLNAREWLEHERLTGLPHADFAGEALRQLDLLEDADGLVELIDDAFDGPDDLVATANMFRDFRDAVLTVLVDAGVIDDDVPADQVGALLRMFLPV